MYANGELNQQVVDENTYVSLSSKLFKKEICSADEIQVVKNSIKELADTLVEVESITNEEALSKAYIHVRSDIEKKGLRGGNSNLPIWTKEFLRECSERKQYEVSVVDAAIWLKQNKNYEPRGNNAIGDVLGYGCHCLESRGSGKNKIYFVPDHQKYSEFYNQVEDVPPHNYYSKDGWNQIIARGSAPSSNGRKKKSRFRERQEIQTRRQKMGHIE